MNGSTRQEARELAFDSGEVVRLVPGERESAGLYVHAGATDGVVYNNQRHRGVTVQDAHVPTHFPRRLESKSLSLSISLSLFLSISRERGRQALKSGELECV